MDREELDLINFGLSIASERPARRTAAPERRPVVPMQQGSSRLTAATVTELGFALRRACLRRGLMPPHVGA